MSWMGVGRPDVRRAPGLPLPLVGPFVPAACSARVPLLITSSTIMFHSLHPGHFPIHFGEVVPQVVHAKTVLTLAVAAGMGGGVGWGGGRRVLATAKMQTKSWISGSAAVAKTQRDASRWGRRRRCADYLPPR